MKDSCWGWRNAFSAFKTSWNVLAFFVAAHHIHFGTVAPKFFFFFFFFSPSALALAAEGKRKLKLKFWCYSIKMYVVCSDEKCQDILTGFENANCGAAKSPAAAAVEDRLRSFNALSQSIPCLHL